MLETDSHKTGPTERASTLDARQAVFLRLTGCVWIMLGTVVLLVFGPTGAALLPMAVFAAIGVVAVCALPDNHPHDALGTANIVTLLRGGLTAFVSAAILSPEQAPWSVFCVAVVAFALDGLDGFLARREGLTSVFGARFDMEVDAVLAATLSLVLLTSGKVGPEVLILGFMRYGFVGASVVWPWLNGRLPDSMRRKAVCVFQIATLIFLLCPLAPAGLLMPVSLCAALMLTWSFAVDVRWLSRAPR